MFLHNMILFIKLIYPMRKNKNSWEIVMLFRKTTLPWFTLLDVSYA